MGRAEPAHSMAWSSCKLNQLQLPESFTQGLLSGDSCWPQRNQRQLVRVLRHLCPGVAQPRAAAGTPAFAASAQGLLVPSHLQCTAVPRCGLGQAGQTSPREQLWPQPAPSPSSLPQKDNVAVLQIPLPQWAAPREEFSELIPNKAESSLQGAIPWDFPFAFIAASAVSQCPGHL